MSWGYGGRVRVNFTQVAVSLFYSFFFLSKWLCVFTESVWWCAVRSTAVWTFFLVIQCALCTVQCRMLLCCQVQYSNSWSSSGITSVRDASSSSLLSVCVCVFGLMKNWVAVPLARIWQWSEIINGTLCDDGCTEPGLRLFRGRRSGFIWLEILIADNKPEETHDPF